MRPDTKPCNPHFSSGPCSKRPGYDLSQLGTDTLGRSHRAPIGKAALQHAIDHTARLLKLPSDYRVGIVPASDTGAVEMALWSLLGPRPVTVACWESFGKTWLSDIRNQLQLENVTELSADYGHLPPLHQVDNSHDVIFTWNGTTSGVRVPNADWISDDREGLTICDATSAVFAMEMPWEKLDVVTYSWQKVLGGEGAHGMLILSPRAVERLESYTPPWPMPKIFRLTKQGKLIEGIFRGATINTPSMLALSDYQDALDWVERIGGVDETIRRCNANLAAVASIVDRHDWLHFLPVEADQRSNTSVCLTLDISDAQLKQILTLLEEESVAYDIGSYRDAPNGIRIWCGATIEASDVACLMTWIVWAYTQVS